MSIQSVARRALATLSGGGSAGSVEPAGAVPWRALALRGLDGALVDPAALEGHPVLVVNVASKCGFTPQYAGLQALWERKRAEGFVILGVPCNQFAWQEPGDGDQIASFCSLTYGVDFPLLEKQDVNGAERSPLYRHLLGGAGVARVEWNFEKVLVGRDGAVLGHWPSAVKPEDPALVAAVEGAVGG